MLELGCTSLSFFAWPEGCTLQQQQQHGICGEGCWACRRQLGPKERAFCNPPPRQALAIEKLLMVTSTRQPDTQLPPPPLLAALGGVNVNPKSPYLDGRPPLVSRVAGRAPRVAQPWRGAQLATH